MLTKIDLSRIKKIVREEIETETVNLGTSLRSEIKLARMEMQNDIKNLSSRVKDLEIRVKDVQKDLRRIEKKLDKPIDFLDRDYLGIKKRVEAIEQRVNLSH